MRRVTMVSTPVAHLVGPGKVQIVNSQPAFVAHEQPAFRLDIEALEVIYCYGRVAITETALDLLQKRRIQVAWFTASGFRFRAWLNWLDGRETALRLRQHQLWLNRTASLQVARWLVAGKIEAQTQAARIYQRHSVAGMTATLNQLRNHRQQLDGVTDMDVLRGVEGAASAAWFRALGEAFSPPWEFRARVRRPPTDPVNALLSLGYTWLLSRTRAHCQAQGLETDLGTLHAYRPGRPSLACDLMEPLRTPAVDRWVLGLFNGQQVQPENFVQQDRAVGLTPAAFAACLASWETFWQQQGLEASLDRLVAIYCTHVRQLPLHGPDGIVTELTESDLPN